MLEILLLLTLFSQIITTAAPIKNLPKNPIVQYFLNPKNRCNITQTQEELFKLGFKKIFFKTKDNVKICGLFLDKSKKEFVKGTILYCAGFYPGIKEGMCSFYSLIINQPYNVLLFDARGHQESDGDFLSYQGLKNYGKNEYLDIVAAIEYIYNYNQQHSITNDIIIHGICSGAFHAVKAVHHLIRNDHPQAHAIKGIIFDSGWFDLSDVVESSIYSEISKRLKNSWFSWSAKYISSAVYGIYKLFFADEHSSLEGIRSAIQEIKCPIFFVHCTNDPFVSIKPVQEHTQKCCCKYTWWIPHDSHANYHEYNYQHYQEKLLDFLNITH